jgi:soluble lytic murein transglycosylase-like protein
MTVDTDKFDIFGRSYLRSMLLAGLAMSSCLSSAEIYIYQGPNGERLVTDRPPHQTERYNLVATRDDYGDAGRIAANRPIGEVGPENFRPTIHAAARKYQVDPALVEAVIQVESNFDPNAVSRAGATGLMQLMEKTAAHYQVYNRFNPHENIRGGVAHLRDLMDRFEGKLPLVLAAYNAGSTAVNRYRGVPPYPETRRYIQKVMKAHNEFRGYRYGDEST